MGRQSATCSRYVRGPHRRQRDPSTPSDSRRDHSKGLGGTHTPTEFLRIPLVPLLLRRLSLGSFLATRLWLLRRVGLLRARRRDCNINLLVDLLLNRLPIDGRFDRHILLERR